MTRRPSRRLAVLFLAVVAVGLASSPRGAAQAPAPVKRGGLLVLARQGEATNLDPHKVPAFTSHRVFELVYSTLTRLGPDLSVQPELAESWTLSSDGRQLTLRLRPARFHNGEPLSSADVKFTFERILNPQTKAVARAFFADLDRVEAPDPRTVVLHLRQPNVALLIYMAHPNASIVSEKVARAANDDLSRKEHAIGTGPFRLAEWAPDNFMRFEASRDFYVQGQPYLDGVRINIVPDEAGLTAALRTKAADLALIADARVAQTLAREAGLAISAKPSLNYHLLFLNTKRKPLDHPKVRQAIASAIDRKQIIDTVALGAGDPTGPLPPALPFYALPTTEFPLYTRDVARARRLLQEAGVGPVQLTLLTQSTEPVYAKDIAQIVQQQLGEAGIKVTIELLEFGQWVQRWLKADFEMAPGLNSGQPDPDFYLFRYFTNDGNLNFVHSYQNDAASDAIKRARALADPQRRRELYAVAQRELVTGVPFVWLYVGRDYVGLQATTKGFVHLPTGSVAYLRQTWLDK
ncbi:MAG TPA: ABC transporter substrate-binding protein [Methylomirabilota bacterium]|jgi:peptide/nickel transport system substrate-binding protein|nr:ABC transporter substrate-binding protein [Methylomirabilota bacterium]